MMKKAKSKTIKKNLILSVSLIIFILCSTLGIISFTISKKSILSSTNNLLKNKASDAAQLTDETINRYITNIETLSHLEYISNPEIPWKDKIPILKKEAERLDYINLGIADTNATLSLIDGSIEDINDKEFFLKAMEGEAFFSQPFVAKNNGEELIAISTPVKHKDETIGVLVGYKAADNLYRIAEDIDVGETGYAVIVNDEIDIISHASKKGENQGKTKIQDYIHVESESAKKAFAKMEEKIYSRKIDTGTFIENEEIMYTGFAPISSKDWSLMVVIAEKEILRDLNKLTTIIAGATFLAIILGIILSNFTGNSISRPIISLTEAASKIVNFDFSEDLDNELLKEKNEIGDLAKGYQTIIDIQRQFMEEISETSKQVAASSEELTAISNQATDASTSVAHAAGDIAYSSENQLKEILNVVAAMEKISTQIENISIQSREVNNISGDVLEKASIGKENIIELTQQMDSINNSTANVKDSLSNISKSSKKMDEIIEVIQNIAEQTNLLALNAAIEAARAGESGKGFSVVAEEIRALAENTHESTEEIYMLLVENQNVIDGANINMDTSQKDVEIGIEAVNITKATFEEISNFISKIGEEIDNSAKAIAEVAQNAADVLKSADSLENISKDISYQTQNVSAATEEQTASMEEIASSSKALDQMAGQLQRFIGQIKVEV